MKRPATRGRVTLKDIAHIAGLSRGAVSLALRDSPRISAATRERVLALAREMGYQPNPLAAGLASLKRNAKADSVHSVIAWINCWSSPAELRGHREFDAYWRGAQSCAAKFGYRLEEFRVGPRMSLVRLEQVLSSRGIHAILLPPHYDPVDWGDFRWSGFSIIRFGRSLSTPRAHIVTSDQTGNAILAFEAMLARGYERVGWVGVKDRSRPRTHYHLFDAGFLAAQTDLKKPQQLPSLILDQDSPYTHAALLERWLEREKPDAIFTEHPTLCRTLEDTGYRVPDDVGVAGTTLLDTDATAGIDQHPEEIGRVAVLALISLINDDARGVPPIFRQILVEGTWVDGPSLPCR